MAMRLDSVRTPPATARSARLIVVCCCCIHPFAWLPRGRHFKKLYAKVARNWWLEWPRLQRIGDFVCHIKQSVFFRPSLHRIGFQLVPATATTFIPMHRSLFIFNRQVFRPKLLTDVGAHMGT